MSSLIDRVATLSVEKRQLLVRRLDPLSFVQERLWFLHQLAPDVPVYNIPLPLLLAGPIDITSLARSLAFIEARHEILRTTFPGIDGRPVQHVAAPTGTLLRAVDLEHVPPGRQDALRQRLLDVEVRRVFDVERGPLWRRLLVRLAPDRHVLMLTWHHLVYDGWSRSIVLAELAACYERFAAGAQPVLPPLAVQYRHFARAQRASAGDAALDAQLAYWRTQLGDDLPTLELPTDHPHPSRPGWRGADEMFTLAPHVADTLRAMGREDGITLFMVLVAGWALLLQKYGGVRDVVIGTVTSGRARPEFERLIGCFVNTLSLRVAAPPDMTVRALLRRVREIALGAFAHQDVPFDRLVNELLPERRPGATPFFRAWLMLENTPGSRRSGERGQANGIDIAGGAAPMGVQELAAADRTARFDLSLTVKDMGGDGVSGPLRYAADLFERDTIVRLMGHLRTLFEAMAASPEARVSELSLLTRAEQSQIAHASPVSPESWTAPLLTEAFDARVAAAPDAIAVAWRDARVSYAALDGRASQLAHRLRAAGAGHDTPVAVCLTRSIDLLVALWGILKAGAAYVPLDPALPPARLALMLDETRPRLVVTEEALRDRLPASGGVVLSIDGERAALDREPRTNPGAAANVATNAAADAARTAYILYTSGSTGRPKGVAIPHGAVASFLIAMDRVLGRAIDRAGAPAVEAAPDGVWLATTNLSFDISVLELLWTLTRGMQVVLHSGEMAAVAPPAATAHPAAPRRLTTFSLFYFASDAGARPGPERYRLLLEGARFADANGLSSIWMPERHFHSFGGIYPNPSVTAAAVAAITTRVRIRAGSVVLPLHDPIRVAEEWAVVDNLSGGRVGVSFASGWHANDFVLAPERYHARRQEIAASIATVQALWRGEAVTRRGPMGQDVEVRVHPRPVQPSLPVWLTSGGSPETFQQAGALGTNLLTHLLGQTIEELGEKIALYREAWRANGHGPGDGHVTLMLHTFLGDDLDAVRDVVRAPFSAYLRDSAGLLSSLARSTGHGAAVDALAPEDLDALVRHAFDRYFGTSGLFGTPESASTMVRRLKEIGVDEIGCLVDFGVEANTVLASLRHLAALMALVRDEERRRDDEISIAELIETRGVTHFQCTPTLARLCLLDPAAPAALRKLRALLVGGEALPPELALELSACAPGRLHNMYGPTETTIWSSTDPLADARDITIGRPLANSRMVIVDRDDHVAPPGVHGEIQIGGAGVARGYWNRPELTADRFVPDPWAGTPGARRYRTGDRGRRRADGRIEFLGRVDHQVKLRGRRIELREIEAVLRAHEAVRDAVVLLREDVPGEPRLVAYVLTAEPGTEPLPERLRTRLGAQLPAYMMPTAIVTLDGWPMTRSGKVDRRALPAPGPERPAPRDSYVAPRTPAEAALSRVWGDVLRLDRVGIHDNFFALGGDSILSLQIVARALHAGWRLAPRHLFEHQTVAALAQVAQAASGTAAVERTMAGPVPLLPIQSWFFERERPAPHHYNQQVLLEAAPGMLRVLPRAWTALLAHHDALRLRFARGASGWTQMGTPPSVDPSRVPAIDLSAVSAAALPRVWERAASAVQASLSLEQGPLVRPVVLIAPAAAPHLFIVGHHLIVDGVSWRVLLEDLQAICRQLTAGAPVTLPPKTSSVRQWADGLRALASTGALTGEVDLWRRMSEPAATLPRDLADEASGGRTTRTAVVGMDREDTLALIQELPSRGVAQVQELLLAALTQALAEWTREPAWRIDLEGHGREHPGAGDLDVSRTVGWLTSLYPVRLTAAADPFETLRSVKRTLREVPHHGLGYGVLRYADDRPETETVRTAARAEIIFNYLGQVDQVLEPGGALRPARLPAGIARDPRQPREYALEINGIVRGGVLTVAWSYSDRRYRAATIDALGERFLAALRVLIAESRVRRETRPWLVPADFPLCTLTEAELGELAARGAVADVYPLAPLQLGLLFHSVYAAADRSSLYTIQFHSRVDEDLDPELFKQAWRTLAARHAVLRTAFFWTRDTEPLQVVYDDVDVPCAVEDWRGLPAVEQDARRDSYISGEMRRGFDLRRAPLMRVALLRVDERVWHIVWTAHHAVVDGWSVPLVMGEALRIYHALMHGGELPRAHAGQYRDYIAWVQRQDLAKAESWWRRTLDGFTAPSLMAADSRHGMHRTISRQTVYRVLSPALAERLQALGRAHALTLNTWLVGAWALLIAHYTRTPDVLFGTVVSGRPPHLPDIERTLGVFANTLPLRVRIPADQALLAWLASAQRQQTEARDYEFTPLVSAQAWSAVPAGTPLFDTLFIYENYPVDPAPNGAAGVRFASAQSGVVIPTTYPLVMQVEPSSGGVSLEIVHDPAVIPGPLAREILERFEALVELMAAKPDGDVGACLAHLAALEHGARARTLERSQARHRDRLRHLQRT